MIHVFYNANAGATDVGADLRTQLEGLFDAEVVVTQTRGAEHAQRAVCEAAQESELIIAAGGDGTVHAVINGLMQVERRPPLGGARRR